MTSSTDIWKLLDLEPPLGSLEGARVIGPNISSLVTDVLFLDVSSGRSVSIGRLRKTFNSNLLLIDVWVASHEFHSITVIIYTCICHAKDALN